MTTMWKRSHQCLLCIEKWANDLTKGQMTPQKRMIKQDSPRASGLQVSFSQCKMFVLLFQLFLLMLPFTGMSYILKREVHFPPLSLVMIFYSGDRGN